MIFARITAANAVAIYCSVLRFPPLLYFEFYLLHMQQVVLPLQDKFACQIVV